jgi:DNA-binding transcriptional LysR family regulator
VHPVCRGSHAPLLHQGIECHQQVDVHIREVHDDIYIIAAVDLNRVDLNLLVAFEALMEERSVTAAASRLDISQSAMSSTLSRIRKLFDDPILMRSGRAMVATPVAEALFDPVRATLTQIQTALTGARPFDPEVDRRTFRIMATGHAGLGLLHPLLVDITLVRPNIQVEIEPIADELSLSLLRSQADLVVLPRALMASRMETGSEELLWEVLYRDRYVLAADKDNEQVKPAMTVEDFSSMPYLAALGTDGGPSAADLNLNVLGIPRRVEVTTGLSVAPFMLRDTNLITLIPRIPASRVASAAGIQLLEPPMQLQPISETMVWLRRLDGDPGHAWLRDSLRTHASRLMGSVVEIA